MSKYTTEVRFICESAAGNTESGGFDDLNEMLVKAAPKVFNFNFPFWNEELRTDFEVKFLRHYFVHEIGFETVGLWKQRLQSKLYDIMPYYIELYNTTVEKFGIFDNVDYVLSHTQNDTKSVHSESTTNSSIQNESNGNSSINDVNRRLYQDTPQGGLQKLEDETYLTNATKITDNQNIEYADNSSQVGSQNSAGSGTDELSRTFTTTKKGTEMGKSKAKMLMEFRDTIVNIELQVIEACADLFMLIF